MTPKRRTARKTVRKAAPTSKYVLEATFKLRSAPITKSQVEAKARQVRAKGATTRIVKVK